MAVGNETRLTLRRAIALLGAVLLTISAITPASSMFIIIPGAINQAGTGVVWSLIIAAAIGVIMACVYGELASAYPSAGGEYVMAAKILGLAPSYVTLVLNAVVMTLISAVLALGAGDYFSAMLPNVPTKVTALAIVGLATMFGILNIKLNAWVTGAFLMIELICIVFFANLAATHAINPLTVFVNPVVSQSGALVPASVGVVFLATATVLFAFNGYEQAVYLAEEIQNVRVIIPRVIIVSLCVSLVLESTPTALLILAMRDLPSGLASSAPFQDLTAALAGQTARKYMGAGISIAVLNACIVNTLMTARFLYSTGRDGFWGSALGARLSRIQASQGTPWVATLVAGVISGLACFVKFNFLLVLTGTGLVLVYAILCVCVLVGRRNGTTARAQFRVPWYPILPFVGVLSLFGVAVANWFDPVVGRPSLELAFVEAALALAIYIVVRFVRREAPMQIADPE